MQLQHIDLDKLSISKMNMRHGRKKPDVSDILPSVRKRGVLLPALVRPAKSAGCFTIVAGRRRYFAALEAAKEQDEPQPLVISICSTTKLSRVVMPGSRNPSTKTSERASWPRMI